MLFRSGVLGAVDDGLHHGGELVAQEDGHHGGRGLLGAQAVVVARKGHGGAQEVLILVHPLHKGGQEQQEAGVLAGGAARLEQVVAGVGSQGPVVVLARAVDAGKGLLMEQAHQAVLPGHLLHHVHGDLVVVAGDNLFKPGSTPSQNARFLLFMAAFVKGVDEYQDFLRATVAFAGNDHRLGAQEAPPAVVSIFLGDELTAVVESIIHGTEYSDPGKKSLRVGVDVMPPIPQDNTDRNRTSPMAFTGNKFEFRMLGSSQSIAGPNIALNTIMAEELEQFADELEGADDFNEALAALVRRVFTQHQRIIFNGNGYEDAWLQEAARRGLSNLTSTADALPVYTAEKNVDLFTKHGIFTREEMEARREIHMENYCHVLSIEANTMADMIKRDILPAASAYAGELARRALGRAGSSACRYETTIESRISELTDGLLAACEKLEADLKGAPEAVEARLTYFHAVVFEDMTAARKLADQLETLVERKAWPFPTYSDMLFYM